MPDTDVTYVAVWEKAHNHVLTLKKEKQPHAVKQDIKIIMNANVENSLKMKMAKK